MTQDIRENVRKKYAQAITNKLNCCGTSTSENPVTGKLYEKNDVEGLSEDIVKASLAVAIQRLLPSCTPGKLFLISAAGPALTYSSQQSGLDLMERHMA